jgi:Tol biopolymer transport system component
VAPVGEPRQITQFRRGIDTLTWTPDGRELIFSAEGPGGASRYLYRIAVSGSGTVRDLADIRVEGSQPSISPDGHSLAYSRRTAEQFSIWSLEPFSGRRPERLAVSSGKDWTADVSADSRHIVFASSSSGPPELWVSAIDGSGLKRAVSLGEAGAHAPRWSPDGRQVVFQARPEEQWDLYIADAEGRVQRLTTDSADDIRPSWSADGRLIYFCSYRTGRPEIWKTPVFGGQPVQVTHRGGSFALESPDGKTVYYASMGQPASLRRVAAGGGEEADVIPGILGPSGFTLCPEGIFYYTAPVRAGSNSISFYSFSARASRPVATIEHSVRPVLSLAGRGRRLLYTQVDRRDSEIVLLENFR